MSHQVFADMWMVAARAGTNKSIARFPDVCLSPPSPPAGPLPVPYPDTSFSTDLKNGSTSVKVGGKPAALAQKSYYKPTALGDEAATRSFGGNIITRQITGKTYFQAWSMDVKFEGKNVCRHIDITTSNHGSHPSGSPPAPSTETQTLADAAQAVQNGKCPCCGNNLHPWQKDQTGEPFKPIKENDFWQKKINKVPDPSKRNDLQTTFDAMKKAKAASRAGPPSCPNVHPDEEGGCAIYFDMPSNAQSMYTSRHTKESKVLTPSQIARKHFKDADRSAVVEAWEAAKPGSTGKGVKMNHKTPLAAGGCNNPHNVVPAPVMKDGVCPNIEKWQSELEQIAYL